jgi:isoleucyl-tRNA synthetase
MKNIFPSFDPQKSIAEHETDILKFWKENQIFEKSVNRRAKRNEFVFFDGPPFATGTPHYGHILAGAIKDVIPRYKTMQGYRVNRKWGWDCHGVPVEFQVEKEHRIGGKPGIEKMGVGKFNELCRSVVLRCADQWESTVDRMGRFVNFKDDYKTMDPEFMESVWWVFGELWKKGLIYEGEKVVSYSPKLGSPLSNFEANLNYKDIDDPAVTVKFELTEESKTYFLAWTTTPWTLLSNLALAVNPKLEYVKVKNEESGESYWLGKGVLEKYGITQEGEYTEFWNEVERRKGKDLIGKSYTPLFPFFENHENAFQVLSADYVSAEEGTGIVHQAPNFGEDDAKACHENNIGLLENPIDEHGFFNDKITELKGKYFRDDPEVEGSVDDNANKWVLDNLGTKLFMRNQIRHSYPHCWRTDSALMYRGIKTWFVDVQKIKKTILEQNQNINWVPEHLKDGRFGKMLIDAPDWAISRNRYWGTPIPVWRCDACGDIEVMGSRADLEKKIDKKVEDLHKHFVDDMEWGCAKCKGKMKRIEEVLDCWFESGAMPYASQHYPFANKEKDVELREVKTTKDWETYHELVKTELFERLLPSLVYDKNYPDGINPKTVSKILFLKDEPIGVLSYGPADAYNSLKEYAPKDSLFLRFIAIKKEFQGRGFGHSAIKDFKSFGYENNFENLILNSAPGAVGFYEKHGFEKDFWTGHAETNPENTPFGKKSEIENLKSKIADFPSADFIAEGLDQTRGWFYTLHVLGCALFGKNIFKNVITNGIVLAEDGQKMSKSKKNYPDPNIIFDKYGADAMRFYMLNSPVVRGENFRFAENGVAEVLKQIILPLRSSYQFFSTYANIDNWQPTKFLFVRHGEGDHNVAHIYSGDVKNKHHLTEKGRAQITETAKHIRNFDVLVASPFIRTQETAEILKKECKFEGEIITDDRVRELFFGKLEGKPFLPKTERLSNKETEQPEAVAKRVSEFMSDMAQKYPGKTIAVASHGGAVLEAIAMTNRVPHGTEDYLRVFQPPTGTETVVFAEPVPQTELDQWILSELQTLIEQYKNHFDAYDLEGALKLIPGFIDNLNNWYLRRSRRRFWAPDMSEEKQSGYETLHHVLFMVSKILAPVCPFFAEDLFQKLAHGESVHLTFFPFAKKEWQNEKIEDKIRLSREIVSLAAGIRARAKVKLRQPLEKLQFMTTDKANLDLDILKEEANVKAVEQLTSVEGLADRVVRVNAKKVGPRLGKKVQEIIAKGKSGDFELLKNGDVKIADEILTGEEFSFGFVCEEGVEAEATARTVVILNTEISENLKLEGFSREVIRAIQELRKKKDFDIADRISIRYATDSIAIKDVFKTFESLIAGETLAEEIIHGEVSDPLEELDVDGEKLTLEIAVVE